MNDDASLKNADNQTQDEITPDVPEDFLTKVVKIVIVGAGKVGSTLAMNLDGRGFEVLGCTHRSKEAANKARSHMNLRQFGELAPEIITKADVVIISTPDDAIYDVAMEIMEKKLLRQDQFLLHVSAIYSSDIIIEAKKQVSFVGSLHPVHSFAASPNNWEYLPIGTRFVFEGDREARHLIRRIVRAVGGKPIKIHSEDKLLYNIAASLTSNAVVSLLHIAEEIYEEIGITTKVAQEMYLPLVDAVLFNIRRNGVSQSLTGPVPQGKSEVIAEHLSQLEKRLPDLLHYYRSVMTRAVDIAYENGVPEEILKPILDQVKD